MMKKPMIWMAAAVSAVALSACGQEGEDNGARTSVNAATVANDVVANQALIAPIANGTNVAAVPEDNVAAAAPAVRERPAKANSALAPKAPAKAKPLAKALPGTDPHVGHDMTNMSNHDMANMSH